MKSIRSLIVALACAAPALALAANTHNQHLAAHEHGIAELNIAVEGDQVVVELISPAHNLLGFEHAPRTAAEKARLREVMQLLERETLLRFNEEAGCRLQEIDIESDLADNAGSHDEHDAHDHHRDAAHDQDSHHPQRAEGAEHEHENEHAAQHSEFQLLYSYQCQRPGRLARLELGLWAQFEALHEIRGQAITPGGQRLLRLHRGDGVAF